MTTTYDAGQIAVAFGANILGGFSEDGVCEVERTNPSWTTHVGADGEVSRTRNRNQSGTIKIKLKRTSQSNKILSDALAQDELDGTGVEATTVQDLLGDTLHFAEQSWVMGPPTDTFDTEEGEREWTIACGTLSMTLGGNDP